MAAISRVWIAHEIDSQTLKTYIPVPGFKGIQKKKISRKRNNNRQVAAILIIGGKLKI